MAQHRSAFHVSGQTLRRDRHCVDRSGQPGSACQPRRQPRGAGTEQRDCLDARKVPVLSGLGKSNAPDTTNSPQAMTKPHWADQWAKGQAEYNFSNAFCDMDTAASDSD